MRYVVVFQDATAEFDMRRETPLEISTAGRIDAPVTEPGTGYDLEVRHALECVRAGAAPLVTLADAAAVTRILRNEEHEILENAKKSARKGDGRTGT
jgi:hypothetical protein